jgi:hypothetical protein
MLIASAKSKDISHFYGKFAMSLTTLAAWWGAILSTGGFLWDIYKYRHAGPKLRFHVRTGMKSIGMPSSDGGCAKTQMRDRRMVGQLAIFDCRISTGVLRSMSF